MLGTGLSIVVGLAGLLDLGYVAFYAVGAYSYALLSQHFGLTFWECLPLAGLLAAGFGLALGFPVLRLRGDYLAIVTLGFGEMVHVVLVNWTPVTGGPNGIGSIPRPDFFGIPFAATAPDGGMTFAQYFDVAFSPVQRIYFLYYLILAMALIAGAVVWRLRRLPLGRAWEALREDEIACVSLGSIPQSSNCRPSRLARCSLGLQGAFFAARQGSSAPKASPSWNRRSSSPLWSWAEWAVSSASSLPPLCWWDCPNGFVSLRATACWVRRGHDPIMTWRPTGLSGGRTPTVRLKRPTLATRETAAAE